MTPTCIYIYNSTYVIKHTYTYFIYTVNIHIPNMHTIMYYLRLIMRVYKGSTTHSHTYVYELIYTYICIHTHFQKAHTFASYT